MCVCALLLFCSILLHFLYLTSFNFVYSPPLSSLLSFPHFKSLGTHDDIGKAFNFQITGVLGLLGPPDLLTIKHGTFPSQLGDPLRVCHSDMQNLQLRYVRTLVYTYVCMYVCMLHSMWVYRLVCICDYLCLSVYLFIYVLDSCLYSRPPTPSLPPSLPPFLPTYLST